MEFTVTNQSIEQYSGDCCVVFVHQDQPYPNNDLQGLIALNNFDAKIANTLSLNRVEGFKTPRLLVVGLGDAPVTAKNYVKAIQSLATALESAKVGNVFLPSVEVDA